jgi:hypothetical protein
MTRVHYVTPTNKTMHLYTVQSLVEIYMFVSNSRNANLVQLNNTGNDYKRTIIKEHQLQPRKRTMLFVYQQ